MHNIAVFDAIKKKISTLLHNIDIIVAFIIYFLNTRMAFFLGILWRFLFFVLLLCLGFSPHLLFVLFLFSLKKVLW